MLSIWLSAEVAVADKRTTTIYTVLDMAVAVQVAIVHFQLNSQQALFPLLWALVVVLLQVAMQQHLTHLALAVGV
jgi:hypothetical protein